MAKGLFAKKSIQELKEEVSGKKGGLSRTLTGLNLVTMGIGAIVGAGVFVLVGQAAANYAGPAVAFSFVLAALICVFAAFGRYNRWVILAVLAVCIYELSGLLPDFREWLREGMPSITESMKASSPHVELVREFLGVAICMIVLIFQYIRCRLIALRQE